MAKFACCVPHCRNCKGKAPPGTAWHAFPKNEIFRNAWIVKIATEVGGPFHQTKHSRVCSCHFRDSDYRPHLNTKLKLLKRTAVPSVFDWKASSDKSADRDVSQSEKASNETAMPANLNNNNNTSYSNHNGSQHITVGMGYESVALHNGHCPPFAPEEEAVPYPYGGAASPASDTYELTELTPMVKTEPGTTTTAINPHSHHNNQHGHGDPYSDRPDREYRSPSEVDDSNGGSSGGHHYVSSSVCFDEIIRKCVISETFLFTMLRLIKCPQCGFGANPEQMHKYENQGCLLGVRLMCYHGHLVLDWRI